MIRAFVSVSLWTLVSRITGFLRDVLLAQVLGAGLLMDALSVAMRLPNHFRAIFAEGAFNTAFVPAFTRIRAGKGAEAAADFQGRVLGMVLASQFVLLALVLAFTPGFVRLLAPGFTARPDALALATELLRITFPYLALVTLVTLWAGVLNAEKRFAEGAAAPVLLNLAMISTLIAAGRFASPAHAAAWGVFIAGFLEAGLLLWGVGRIGLLARPRLPRLDEETRRFFRAFGPAVIGAAGVQIAMFADTIIVTFLPAGGASSLYYADRLYQLPLGIVAIAAGTVLLPEMTRLIAENREADAYRQQNRILVLTWLLSAPFFAAFLAIPEAIVAALFQRGAFDAPATSAAAAVLAAYGIGLPAAVAIRSMAASFNARGDTRTPLYASLSGIALNLALKLALWRAMGAAGIALATAIGGIANFAILFLLAKRQGKSAPDAMLGKAVLVITGSAALLAGALLLAERAYWPLPALPRVMIDGAIGALAYGGFVYLGFVWLRLPLKLR